MGERFSWLQARKRNKQIILRLKKILGGSVIAALIVGPLIYFGVAAQETAQILEGDLRNKALRESAATPEVRTSQKPIEFPKVEVKKPEKKEKLDIEIKTEKMPEALKEPEFVAQTAARDIFDDDKTKIAAEFNKNKEEISVKTLETNFDGLQEKSVVMDEVAIDYGPAEIKNEPDANAAARTALQKYLNTLEEKDNYAVLKDTSKLDQANKPDVLVLTSIVNHNGKWYADFKQYHNMLPVFDGNAKLIFTEKKKLLVLTDNIRRNLPAPEEFQVGTAVAQESTKELFEWDENTDQIQFINKGYYKEKPAYKVETEAHNPMGQWDVYVNGVDGSVEGLMTDIRTQDEPLPVEETAPAEEPVPTEETTPSAVTETPAQPEVPVTEETITEEITPPAEEPAVSEETPSEPPATEQPATTEPEIIPEIIPETTATTEPEIEILQTLLGQVFGKIYPKTPNDAQETVPFANEYIYINQNRVTTDAQGYFDNPGMSWYSLFLEGPYATIKDGDATVNADIVDQTPEDPFTWDENTASLAAINAFYHTNKIREWAKTNLGYEINYSIPVAVNSQLVDDYLMGCGAWFDTRDNTIEIGRGGYEGEIDGIRSPCMNDLNYALSSDFIYHEYAHYLTESINHLPYIQGAESAAMAEGLADYFATTINDDSVWGDIVTVRTRDLNNTLKYKYIDENGNEVSGMTGNAHYDGQIFSGALWDLRSSIGAEATDRLVFNTLYQGRLHYETFMYGMIIEDDDNNDFSDGTPHLIQILEAFENHGIGPGVVNFSGLPIDPAEWTKILQEAGYEGQEEPLMMGISGSCGAALPAISVPAAGTCTITAGGYAATTVTVASTGTLNITGGSLTSSGVADIQGAVVVGGTAGVYNWTASNTITVSNGGDIYVGYTTGATGQDATLSGTYLNVYDAGSTVQTRNNANAGIDHIITMTATTTVGQTSNNTGTISFSDDTTNSLGYLNVHGDVYVGTTTSATTLNVTNTTNIYTGGNLAVQGASGYASSFNGGTTMWMYGSATVSVAQYTTGTATTLNIYGSSSASSTLTLNGTWNAASTTKDINVYAYSNVYDGNITIATTGILYANYLKLGGDTTYDWGGDITNNGTIYTDYTYVYQYGSITNSATGDDNPDYLYLGDATGNYTGGTYTNGNTLDVTWDSQVYNGGLLDNNSTATINRLFRMWDGASADNSGTMYVNGTSYYMDMWEACTFTNSGTLWVRGYLLMDESVVAGSGPTITNTGTINIRSVSTTVCTDSAANCENNDLRMNDDSLITNGTSGTTTTGIIDVADDITMRDNSKITNYYWVKQYNGLSGKTNTTDSNQTLTDLQGAAIIDNADTSSFFYNFDSNASTYGWAKIYDTTELKNAGNTDFHIVWVGDSVENITGGTINNESSGDLDINQTGTTTTALQVYAGLVYNKGVADNLDVDGKVLLHGVLGEVGTLQSDDASCNISNLVINDYGTFDNNQGCTVDGNGTTADANVTLNNNNSILDNTGTTLTVNNDLTANLDSTVTNTSGAFAISGDVVLNNSSAFNVVAGTVDVTLTFTMQSTSTMDITSGTVTVTGTSTLNTSATITNDGTVNFNGQTYMNNNSYINNGPGASNASFNFGSAASQGDLNMYTSAHVYNRNNGTDTVTVYDDVVMGSEDASAPYIYNYDLFNLEGSTTNTFNISFDSYVYNFSPGIITVDSDSGIDSDGIINVQDKRTVDAAYKLYNYAGGTINARLMNIGSPGAGSSLNTRTRVYNAGTFNTYTNTASTGLKINMAEFTNASTGTINNNNDGYIYITGTSTSEATKGKFINTSSGTNVGNIRVDSYAYADYQNGTQNATYCFVYETTVGANGYIQLSTTTPTLDCDQINIGNASTDPGFISNSGTVIINTLAYIREDSTANDTYEFTNTSNGKVTGAAIYLGEADGSPAGGEFQNLAGDGYLEGNPSDDNNFVRITNLYIYSGGEFFNGAARDGADAGSDADHVTSNAELDWNTNSNQDIRIYGSGIFNNYGYVGAYQIITDSTVATQYFNNLYQTSLARGGIVGRRNMSGTNLSTIIDFSSGTFNNNGNATVLSQLYVDDVHADGSATFNNYANVNTLKLHVGGEYNNNAYGITNAYSTASDAGMVDCGQINIIQDSITFTIYGRMTVTGGLSCGGASIDINRGLGGGDIINTVRFGELYIYMNGSVTTNDDVEIDSQFGSTGNLYIKGENAVPSPNWGTLLIDESAGVSDYVTLYIDGTTIVDDYGLMEINAERDQSTHGYLTGGMLAVGLVTVNTYGFIDSDITSGFALAGGITSSGTVAMRDDVDATTVTVTGGNMIIGNTTNVGLSNITGKTTVSGGANLYTYNNADMHDIEVTGASSDLYFYDSQTNGSCNTDVHGYLDILNGARATISCTTTSPNAVDVHAGSPGGTTVVEGTLVLNTNMETDDMIIDNGGTYCDTNPCVVTHDIVGPVGNGLGYLESAANTVFNLEVLDDLTINADGSIDVSEKSYYRDLTTDHGGSHGGLGQADSWGTGYASAYGQMDAVENEYGRRGKAMAVGETWGFGGGKASVQVGTTTGDETSILTINGDILANGQTALGGAGSGGSINIISLGTMTGSGSILANGGSHTSGTYTNSAGGGGRIYIGYYNKSGYTGTVLAIGGLEDTNTYAAGTGTIFYMPYDIWYNHNNGTLVIDANGQTIDVNNTSTTTKEDYTRPTEDINIESVQIDRNAGLWVQANVNGTDLYYQQCIEANGGAFTADATAAVYYNPEHDIVQTDKCYKTPDPPQTLYINNSKSKAQTNYPSTKASYATIADVTPAVSAIHNDAELDRNPGDQDTDSTVQYQLQIATSASLLYVDSPDICDVDEQSLVVADDARSADIIVPYASCTLTADDYYYWRIRFKDNESGANGWGLWSYTNWFYLDNGGTIEVTTCSSDTAPYDTIVLGDVAGATADRIVLPTGNFDEEYCTLKIESTTAIFVKANKSTEKFYSGSDTILDMPAFSDSLECRDTGFPLTKSEAAFRLYNLDGMFTAEEDLDNFTDYNQTTGCSVAGPCWHHLKHKDVGNPKVLNSASALLGNTFEFWLGACVINSQPAGSYTSQANLTLTSNP